MTRAKICESCGKEHDGTYGSGRFCCKSCMARFSASARIGESKFRISRTLKERIAQDPKRKEELCKRLAIGATRGRETMHKRWLAKKVNISRDGETILLNITNAQLEEYRKLHPVCEICGSKCSMGRALAIDHDHSNNRFRGLLCAKCNMNYDWFLSNRERLAKYSAK